jgi:hypothetical protein
MGTTTAATTAAGVAAGNVSKEPQPKLTIKIRKDIWNAGFPHACSASPPVHATGKITKHQTPPRQRKRNLRSCKVRIWRFHPGGPQHCRKGQAANSITLEHPCLQITCLTCQRYNKNLLDSNMDAEGAGQDLQSISVCVRAATP